MKRFLWLLILVLLCIGIVSAQIATVKRNVDLHPDPSIDNDPVTDLTPEVHVELIEPDPAYGSLHVKTSDRQESSGRAITVTSDLLRCSPAVD